jgi:hypothetical protein
MHRVLRSGGRAVIEDMSADAGRVAIAAAVADMHRGRLAALTTRLILAWLRRRAYSPAQIAKLAKASAFDRVS